MTMISLALFIIGAFFLLSHAKGARSVLEWRCMPRTVMTCFYRTREAVEDMSHAGLT